MMVQPGFGIWDYVVVGLMLVISSGIGIYYRFTGGKQKTVKVSIFQHFLEAYFHSQCKNIFFESPVYFLFVN